MGDNLNGIFANMIQGMGFIGCAPNRVYNMAPPDGGGVEATAEGTELTLHSAAAPLTALTLYGKSEQETTTGAQLFDANAILENTWIDADNGSEVGSEGFWTSDYIMVKNGLYFCSQKGSSRTAFYNSEKEFIRYFGFKGGQIEVLEGEVYIRITGTNEYAPQTIMFNEGITALPWEPYTGGQSSPSPGYPQEIKSVGDSGTVNVTLSDGGSQSQTLPVQTPNGLPGIPVDSDGNYTDADGQQWVCDEVDFKRGVYVQRVKEISDISWRLHKGYAADGSELFTATNITNGLQIASELNSAYCSKLIRDNRVLNQNISGFYQSYGSVFARIKEVGDLDAFEELMLGAVILYQLATPVETPIPPEEIAAYAALRTYSPTTVVSNDAGAWMNVGYKATPQPMTMLARKR